MTLYEIDNAIMDCVVYDEDGNVESVDTEKLTALEMVRKDKIENVALWRKDLIAEAEAIKAEKDKLDKRQKALETRAESLKAWIANALAGETLKTPRCVISYKPSTSVEIADMDKVPAEYRVEQPWKPDKRALKAAMDQGELFDGISLVTKNNIQIK